MRVTFVTTEAVPYAKTGGLADVSGALPRALADQGIHVDLIMPLYGTLDIARHGLTKLIVPHEMAVPIAGRHEGLGIWWTTLPDSQVQVYFLEHQLYFDRSSLYTDPVTGSDYTDNIERFVYFCRAALAAMDALDLRPDVVHANDYQTALIPAYMSTLPEYQDVFGDTASVYSIHNMAYQGTYPRSAMSVIGIGYKHFYPMSPFEFYGKVNLMKAGIWYSDVVSTVSRRYAQEIQASAEYGHGLEGVLALRSTELHGILNGIDQDVWNPETDQLIPARYSRVDLSGKAQNRRMLADAFGLPNPEENVMVVGIVSRLVFQKGFDLIAASMDQIVQMNVQLVVLGTGDPEYHKMLEEASREYPDRVGVRLKFDDGLAHLVIAGSDVFLMPSRFEPCGLSQMYSLRYGTLPVVRATGGLVDTVDDMDTAAPNGTGFVFSEYTPEAMMSAIQRAVSARGDGEIWAGAIRRAMAQDFSWRVSSEKYAALYESARKRHRHG